MLEFQNPVVGGTTLVRPAIKSPNYVPGTSGWSINADGTAEFTSVIIGGGTTTEITITFSDGSQIHGYAGNFAANVDGSVFSLPGTWFAFRPETVGGVTWQPGAIGTVYNLNASGEGSLAIFSPYNTADAADYPAYILLSSKGSASGSQMTIKAHLLDIIGADSGRIDLVADASVSLSSNEIDLFGPVTLTGALNGVPVYSGVIPSGWTSLSSLFVNGFTTRGGAMPTATTVDYQIDAFGWVTLRGNITGNASSTVGKTILTMPATKRPSQAQGFAVVGNGGTEVYSRVDINPDGTLIWRGPVNVTGGVNWFSLNGIRYLAEQ